MKIAGMSGVSLLEIFVTYLSIGSAFAMRSYFLNRRRPVWVRGRIVLTQCFLWLPIWLFKLIWDATSLRQRQSTTSGMDPTIQALIEELLSSVPGVRLKNQVREAFERYAALHAALDNDAGRTSGQFELFAISGNGNGTTGTPCLYRKNLAKLNAHKIRTANDLIRVIHLSKAFVSNDSQLAAFFQAFGDSNSIAKLEGICNITVIDDSIPIRMAA